MKTNTKTSVYLTILFIAGFCVGNGYRTIVEHNKAQAARVGYYFPDENGKITFQYIQFNPFTCMGIKPISEAELWKLSHTNTN